MRANWNPWILSFEKESTRLHKTKVKRHSKLFDNHLTSRETCLCPLLFLFFARLSVILESVLLRHVPPPSVSIWASELVCVSFPGWAAEAWTAGLREGKFSAVSPRSVRAGSAPPTTLCTESPSSCSRTCWRHLRGRTYSQPAGESVILNWSIKPPVILRF